MPKQLLRGVIWERPVICPHAHPAVSVAIVGAGLVGTTTAHALLVSGTASEIVLIGHDRKRVDTHVHDLRDATRPLGSPNGKDDHVGGRAICVVSGDDARGMQESGFISWLDLGHLRGARWQHW